MEKQNPVKRFYKTVATEAAPKSGGASYRVTLDGRPLKTQGGRPQLVPTLALAEVLAGEWAGQPEEIDPTRFIHRDLADYALDVIAPDRAAAIAALVPYADTDTLCYRAEPDEPLFARQCAQWEPILTAAETRYGVAFIRTSGIIPRPQPEATLARMAEILATLDDFALAALQTTTTLAASLTIGLAALDDGADIESLWNAANLEEDWQAELWGKDEMAEARRARRGADFTAAARFAGLAKG